MAPNSPSETANAKPAAASSGRHTTGRSTVSERPQRAGAQRGGGLALPVVDAGEHGHQGAHHERQRDQRLGDRHQQRRVAQVERRLVEGDQEAEAEGHRGHPERQHEEAVERAAQPAFAAGERAAGDDDRDQSRRAAATSRSRRPRSAAR